MNTLLRQARGNPRGTPAKPTDAPARARAGELASAIYTGWVRHRRHAPHAHAFRYRVAMLYLDLAELEHAFERHPLWSLEGRNLAAFRRADYLGPAELPLDEAVRRRVAEATGSRPTGPIRLLTHVRYLGYVFNPVSFYYCYAADGETLVAIVAEITNTPWKERHAYVLPLARGERHGRAALWRFAKCFHVSPFMAMQRDYAWRFTAPGKDLIVHMDVFDGEAREFDATVVLERHTLDRRGLTRVLLRFPLMTLKVIAAIHGQALRLWLKRNPVHDHPGKHG